jgi:hypothetical protein
MLDCWPFRASWRRLKGVPVLRIKIVVRPDASFEFETDNKDVTLSEVVTQIDRWFDELGKDENIAPQIARLAAEREKLAAAVARQGGAPLSTE